MNTAPLKAYAPQARRDFIAAVAARAAGYGLTAKRIEPVTEQGDVALIGNRAYPRAVAAQRQKLEERIHQQGFAQVMEAMAYTWFNRFMAIRYMELHGYLDHGRRVLSHPDKDREGAFEILDACTEINLPGVDREQVIKLKLDGRKDEELYRLLLLGQCHALHQAMPFLFEPVDDDTELLLPDNLTKTDSLIRHLVNDIPEDDWQQVEIIGWLYQFYISERKDQVVGKVVASEDIPAATQLFTPNWIVKYLVQNSLGAQWLATYPNSEIKEQMAYYIEPAEQTPAVQAQLKAITPTSLNPEELTLIDPACGSGHILVEAYEVFKAIYLERGYRPQDLPQLILEKNLFGIEICPRAAQLTGIALMMKARADDRRLFERGVKLNVMALQDSTTFDAERLAQGVKLADYGLQAKNLTVLKELFEHATTFGSLIQVPDNVAKELTRLKRLGESSSEDLFVSDTLKRLRLWVYQAEVLAAQYDAVVTNPPYMGSGGMNALLKKFAKACFPDAKSDLFACFIERGYTLAKPAGLHAMVTMHSWMFLTSLESFRVRLLAGKSITTMVHMSNGVMGIAFGTAATVLRNMAPTESVGCYSYVSVDDLDRERTPAEFPVPNDRLKNVTQGEFNKIPGKILAYWISNRFRALFQEHRSLGSYVESREGMTTADNDTFMRLNHEVDISDVGFGLHSLTDANRSGRKWFPYQKGGDFRKWFGNLEHIVDWSNDGLAIKANVDADSGRIRSHNYNGQYAFREGFTWTLVGSGVTGARFVESGSMFDANGPMAFASQRLAHLAVGLMNGCVGKALLSIVSPTLAFKHGHVLKLPLHVDYEDGDRICEIGDLLKRIAAADWNAYERSWDFQSLPILPASSEPVLTLESRYTTWITQNCVAIAEMKRLEGENNRLFIDAYGLADELTPHVPIEEITLTVNPAYRYGRNVTDEEQWTRFRQDTMEELVSYAIGCLVGRYSLDAPGLIYAHSGNEGFDSSRYTTFPADDDGIVPLTDTEWFDDDAAHRLIEFIAIAWDKAHLEANLNFLADNLSPKKNESSRETLRRYLCDSFFKNHLQTYKNRPIYWLFSTGKQQAFQCLVYLHRYNEGTLARMRTKYVIPLQGMIAARIEQRGEDIAAATASSHRKRLEKERDTLIKQRTELQQFDEHLRHYADQRIQLDLDDGVKVNYGKFGDLLAEVKTVTGTKAD